METEATPTIAARADARSDRPSPHAYFLAGAVFHYLGLAFAVLLFTAVTPLGIAW